MNFLFFSYLILFYIFHISGTTILFHNSGHEKYLPVYIVYKNNKTADSVEQYFKDAFQERKLKIISKDEQERLSKKEFERVFNIVKANGFDNPEAMIKQIEHYTQPVCNYLQIDITFYKDRKDFSLKWKTYTNLMIVKRMEVEWIKINTEKLVGLSLKNSIESVADSIILSKKLQ